MTDTLREWLVKLNRQEAGILSNLDAQQEFLLMTRGAIQMVEKLIEEADAPPASPQDGGDVGNQPDQAKDKTR